MPSKSEITRLLDEWSAGPAVRVVVDASVAVKWFLPDSSVEPDVDRALMLAATSQLMEIGLGGAPDSV